ncbi:MAG: hypothetical protein JXA10_11940 [Anaerolineae bacterium]|nr:hypothetical protein [Anaerolineae bacterium]
MAGVTSAVTAATAAEKRRQEMEEEDSMTMYTADELRDDWEFKIVRSNFEAFRNPETLQRVIEEEGRAGWIMVEKFDNSRIRFKRPASARANDPMLPPDVNPYRTHIGGTGAMLAGVFIGLLVLLTVGLVAFTIMMAN